ncbi:MAG TPA: hypothetical protein VH817_20615 [Thermoleophilaceae bacterium]
MLIGAGALMAIIVAGLMVSRSATTSGLATTPVIVDTTASELTHASPPGGDSLSWRTPLLAALLTSDEARARIAADIRVPASDVAVIDPTLNTPLVPAALPVYASRAAARVTAPYVVTLLVDGDLPRIVVQAAAPTRAEAGRLAGAASRELALQGSARPSQSASVEGITVTESGDIETKAVTSRAPLKGLVAGTFFFAAWWLGVSLFMRMQARSPRPSRSLRPATGRR